MLVSIPVMLVFAVVAVVLPCCAMGTITPTMRPIAIANRIMVVTIFFIRQFSSLSFFWFTGKYLFLFI